MAEKVSGESAMVSLSLLANKISQPAYDVSLVPERCLRKRLNSNRCQLCIDACGASALSVDGRTIVLAKSRCSGCMACVAVCPQDALVSDFELTDLLGKFLQGGELVVSCIRQKQFEADEIVVPCVGIFSKHLLAAIGVGECRSVTFNVAGCAGCCNRNAAEVFMADYKKVIDSLSEIMSSAIVLAQKGEPRKKSEVNRRAYLANIREMVAGAAKNHFSSGSTTIKSEKKNGRRLPFKTELVKKIVKRLDADSQKLVLSLLGTWLEVNDNCNCCPLCKGMCPTGAIKIERSEQVKKLRLEMLDCSGCGLCVEFCKRGAILPVNK